MSDYKELIQRTTMLTVDIRVAPTGTYIRVIDDLLAALKDTVARAQTLERERDSALRAGGRLQSNRDKWRRLTREAAGPHDRDEWLAKLKELEAE